MPAVDTFLASHTYAETTKRTYQGILDDLAANHDTAKLTAVELVTFVKSHKWGNSRQCLALAACQKYIRWAHGATHPALEAKIKRTRGKPQRALSKSQALELLASFNTYEPKGARDLALCALALDTGLRASELCRLQLAYIDLDRCSLQVVVKGGQWAAAVFSPQTAAHVRHWLHFRQTVNGPGWVFQNIHTGQQLTPEGLRKIVKGWGDNIGIKLTTHDLRRSLACLATEVMGAPERVLMEGGRWHNSEMIKTYTRTLQLNAMRQYLPMLGLEN